MTKIHSPLSEQEVESHWLSNADDLIEIKDLMGRWLTYESFLSEGGIASVDAKTRAYLRTKVYESSKLKRRTLIVPKPNSDEKFDLSHISNPVPVFIEEAVQRAKLMPFRDKAFKTLRNLVENESSPGVGVRLGVRIDDEDDGYPGYILPDQLTEAHKYGYCCQDKELALVFRWLYDNKLISKDSDNIYITPEGYEEVGKLGQGLVEGVHEIFLVCRFANVSEEVLAARFIPVQQNVSVAIKRINDHEHNHDINDEILLKIRSARIVIVDVALDNFNVGFEAGYAFALNKEIIFTTQQSIDRNTPLPFDISTKNVIDHRGTDTDFVQRLTNRIKLILGK